MNDSKRSAPDLVRQGLCAGTRPLPPRSTRRWALRWSCRRSRSRPAASTTSARSSGLIWPGPRRREAFLRGTVRLDLPRWTGRSKLRAGAARWRTGSRAVPKGAAGGAVKAAGLVHLYSRAGHVDAAQQPALQHGGKVLFKPHHYSQRGRQAVLADPDGAVFAVLAAAGGDPGALRRSLFRSYRMASHQIEAPTTALREIRCGLLHWRLTP
jgi:hypothetical protein